jgi:hypothetical protein
MASSTWSADSSTWSGNSYIWDNSTYQVTATMTQTILSKSLLEDTVFPRGVTIGGSYGMSGTTAHVMPASISLANSSDVANSQTAQLPVSGTLAGTSNIKNNVNFPESGTMGMTGSASSDNTFLWNDVEEDTDTLWTKISDPDE